MLLDEVKKIVLKIKKDKINDIEIKSGSSFKDDLGMDSVDMAEIVLAIEDEFNISISDEEAEKMQLVEDVIHQIEEGIKIKSKSVKK